MPRHATFIASTTSNRLLEQRRWPLFKLKANVCFTLKIKPTDSSEKVICSFIADDVLGFDVHEV